MTNSHSDALTIGQRRGAPCGGTRGSAMPRVRVFMKPPEWTADGKNLFKNTQIGAGSPRHIARTCCLVQAVINQTKVNRKAVEMGIEAYKLLHEKGEQPYLAYNVELETCAPYRALRADRPYLS